MGSLALISATLLTLLPLILFAALIIILKMRKQAQLGKTWKKKSKIGIKFRGKELECPHCNSKEFYKREGLLATTWVTFFFSSCWNWSGACFPCAKCGLIQWFTSKEEQKEETL